MTPSQSASQALSRTSSSSSLADQLDFTVSKPNRVVNSNGSTRSPRATSPARAASPIHNGAPPTRQTSGFVPRAPTTRAPAPAPRPVMAPVPSAPRPVSSYTTAAETGIPGFEIPKAPTNVASRRPDEDSSDEEVDRAFHAVQNGIPSQERSSYYPYDAPASSVGPSSGGRLRRRANSDTSSIAPGGRKRRGSFFGSLASLFKKKDRHDDNSDDGRGLRHASSSNWQTRTDKNVFVAQRGGAVGADRPISRAATRRQNDSSDDDMPKNLVRVVNDPKMRAKAMSDVGRPTSMAAPKVKKAKRPKRAASDIGISTAASHPVPLPAPVPTITRKEPTPTPTATPSVRTTTNKTIQEDSTSVKRKRKKAREEPATLVLSAESLGIPTGASSNGHIASSAAPPVRAKLSRSNTNASAATAATGTTAGGTIKRKKKKALVEPSPAPPSAADLSASLPSARNPYNPLTAPLPLPSDIPNPRAAAPPVHVAPPTPVLASEEQEGKGAGKVPKSLAVSEKRSKKDSARYSNGDWVNHPAQPAHKAPTTRAKTDVVEGEDSLMAVVGRAEGGEDRTPSRKYGLAAAPTTPDDAGLAVPRAPSGATTPNGLSKRKSVRLADGPDSLLPPAPSLSPSSSIRSNASPRAGILVNHQPTSASAELAAATGADSTWASRVSANADDSSDEDEEYRRARKAFSKNTKGMEEAMGGRWTAAEKGKGRA